MKKKKIDGFYISNAVWFDDNLSITERILLTKIKGLDEHGECFASNGYFADFFRVSKTRISNMIRDLKKKGYIDSYSILKDGSMEVDKRILKVKCMPHITKVIDPLNEKCTPPVTKVIDPLELNYKDSSKELIDKVNSKVLVIKEKEVKQPPILSKEIKPKKIIKSKNIIVDRTGEVFLESVEANELFLSFLEDRDENPKVKNSPTAIKVLVNKLKDKLSIVQIEMIENSIVSGYPNLYEPRIKNNYNKNNAKQATTNMRDRFGDDTDKVMQGILDGTRKPFQVDIPTEVTIIKKIN